MHIGTQYASKKLVNTCNHMFNNVIVYIWKFNDFSVYRMYIKCIFIF